MVKNIITQEGYDKLQDELDQLVTVGRKEIAAMLKEAVSFGDLSENAEYDSARRAQVDLESKIRVLQDRLSNAEIIQNGDTDTDVVHIGCSVTVLDEEGDEITYKIVGDNEGSVKDNKLSISSIVGGALLGNRVGSVLNIETLAGTAQYKILDIK